VIEVAKQAILISAHTQVPAFEVGVSVVVFSKSSRHPHSIYWEAVAVVKKQKLLLKTKGLTQRKNCCPRPRHNK